MILRLAKLVAGIACGVAIISVPGLALETLGPPSTPQKTGKSDDTKQDPKRLVAPDDASLLKALEKQSAPSQDESNPLERVDQLMRDVQQRLAKSDPGSDTQTIQKEIVDDLDQLIKQANKASSNNKQSKNKRQTSNKQQQSAQDARKQGKPNQAAEPQEGAVARPGDVSDEQRAANERIVRAIWGHLPEKMREEMQQASQDSGLPKYRSLIELYFRAIAEQNK